MNCLSMASEFKRRYCVMRGGSLTIFWIAPGSHFSVLIETYESNPASGAFFPSYLFEQKYLGFRFEREGALHYGWMALSGFAFYGEEIYVYSWAYESAPDTALIVGQLPEPTVPALVGFALWIGMRRGRADKTLHS